jgi:hypothetical protein
LCGKWPKDYWLVPDAVWEFYMKDCSLYANRCLYQEGWSGALHGTVCLTCWNTRVNWKDGGEFERKVGKAAFLWYWQDTGGKYLTRVGETKDGDEPDSLTLWTPIPPGGYLELQCMNEAERERFYQWAQSSGYWDWIPSDRRKHRQK